MANIGIDLGTTHSLVAVVLSGKARCLLDDDERALLPSATISPACPSPWATPPSRRPVRRTASPTPA